MERLDQKILVRLAVLSEIFLLFLALLFIYIFKIDIVSKFIFDFNIFLISMLATLFLLAMNYSFIFILPKYIGFLRPLKDAYDSLSFLFANINFRSIVIIALYSGFAEEIFFRAVLQDLLGIILTAFIFGLVHIVDRKTIPYGIYVVLIGFYLGGLLIYTGSIWVPIIVHIINNACAIPMMKHNLKKLANE